MCVYLCSLLYLYMYLYPCVCLYLCACLDVLSVRCLNVCLY